MTMRREEVTSRGASPEYEALGIKFTFGKREDEVVNFLSGFGKPI